MSGSLKSAIRCSIEGVGSIVDSNLARILRCFFCDALECYFVPKKTFALSQPHISEECSERAKKKRKSWASHLDATDPELADSITKSHFDLFSAAFPPASEALFETPDSITEPFSGDEFRSVCGPTAFLFLAMSCHSDRNLDIETQPDSQPKYVRLSDRPNTLDADLTHCDQIIKIGAGEYVVPDGASFYMGDIREGLRIIDQELVPVDGFRLAVVDPPWPSKSRGKKVTHPPSCIPQIPVPDTAPARPGEILPARAVPRAVAGGHRRDPHEPVRPHARAGPRDLPRGAPMRGRGRGGWVDEQARARRA
jgi:hypothetical protein